jgi:hypothetical protein
VTSPESSRNLHEQGEINAIREGFKNPEVLRWQEYDASLEPGIWAQYPEISHYVRKMNAQKKNYEASYGRIFVLLTRWENLDPRPGKPPAELIAENAHAAMEALKKIDNSRTRVRTFLLSMNLLGTPGLQNPAPEFSVEFGSSNEELMAGRISDTCMRLKRHLEILIGVCRTLPSYGARTVEPPPYPTVLDEDSLIYGRHFVQGIPVDMVPPDYTPGDFFRQDEIPQPKSPQLSPEQTQLMYQMNNPADLETIRRSVGPELTRVLKDLSDSIESAGKLVQYFPWLSEEFNILDYWVGQIKIAVSQVAAEIQSRLSDRRIPAQSIGEVFPPLVLQIQEHLATSQSICSHVRQGIDELEHSGYSGTATTDKEKWDKLRECFELIPVNCREINRFIRENWLEGPYKSIYQPPQAWADVLARQDDLADPSRPEWSWENYAPANSSGSEEESPELAVEPDGSTVYFIKYYAQQEGSYLYPQATEEPGMDSIEGKITISGGTYTFTLYVEDQNEMSELDGFQPGTQNYFKRYDIQFFYEPKSEPGCVVT